MCSGPAPETATVAPVVRRTLGPCTMPAPVPQPLPVAPPGVEYCDAAGWQRRWLSATTRSAGRPSGLPQAVVALSAAGSGVVVSDTRRSRLQVFSSNSFVRTVSRLGPRRPRTRGIVCDSASDEFEDATCYVADRNNHRIQHLRLRDAQVAPNPHARAPAPPHRHAAAAEPATLEAQVLSSVGAYGIGAGS